MSVVPYITNWTAERPLPTWVVERPGGAGIAYADETLGDRDRNGVLWARTSSSPGRGRPEFGDVNSLRQRRAMRKLLCQVCAGPATQDDGGVLWVLKDHRGDWPGWPGRMGVTEPPICLPCLRYSTRACPALRRGHVTVHARRFEIAGVHGMRYRAGRQAPIAVGEALVPFGDPAARWVVASNLVRELLGCSLR